MIGGGPFELLNWLILLKGVGARSHQSSASHASAYTSQHQKNRSQWKSYAISRRVKKPFPSDADNRPEWAIGSCPTAGPRPLLRIAPISSGSRQSPAGVDVMHTLIKYLAAHLLFGRGPPEPFAVFSGVSVDSMTPRNSGPLVGALV